MGKEVSARTWARLPLVVRSSCLDLTPQTAPFRAMQERGGRYPDVAGGSAASARPGSRSAQPHSDPQQGPDTVVAAIEDVIHESP